MAQHNNTTWFLTSDTCDDKQKFRGMCEQTPLDLPDHHCSQAIMIIPPDDPTSLEDDAIITLGGVGGRGGYDRQVWNYKTVERCGYLSGIAEILKLPLHDLKMMREI
ncbi:hypothetical protein R6Q59_023593 [Mikania micrantha]